MDTPTHTRQKLDHYSDPLGTESHDVQLDKNKWKNQVGFLGLAPCHCSGKSMKIVQVRMADQAMYHQGTRASSLVVNSGPCSHPPLYEKRKMAEVLHLFRCYTHTHPAGAGSTLKGKRKKKADTHDGQKDKTAQGGKGTNGPPKPTYTERRA